MLLAFFLVMELTSAAKRPAQQQVEDASRMRNDVLRSALFKAIRVDKNSGKAGKSEDKWLRIQSDKFEIRVDDIFQYPMEIIRGR